MQAEDIIDQFDLVMFFTFKNEIYGSPEESRILFAKMKNEKDEDHNKFLEFEGYDIKKLAKGQDTPATFTKKDLPQIKIIDEDEAKEKIKNIKVKNNHERDDYLPPGVTLLKDKK